MITITDNKANIFQMRDSFKIKQVLKREIKDFGVDMSCGDLRIIFIKKDDSRVVMRFLDVSQFNAAIASTIEITDRMGI